MWPLTKAALEVTHRPSLRIVLASHWPDDGGSRLLIGGQFSREIMKKELLRRLVNQSQKCGVFRKHKNEKSFNEIDFIHLFMTSPILGTGETFFQEDILEEDLSYLWSKMR